MDWALVQKVVRDLTGEEPLKATAPGGKNRESFRVETDSRTLIVSHRADAKRAAREAQVLERLTPLTDLVPAFLGFQEGILLQSDLGDHRFSMALRGQPEGHCREGVRRAFDSLAEIQELMNAGAPLPGIFTAPGTVRGLITSVPEKAAEQGLPLPQVDVDVVQQMLTLPATSFVKWDARAGNAMVSDAARVCWFDFEWAGWRSGLEDFAWGFADENWPLEVAATLEVALRICEDTPHLKAVLDQHGPGVILALGAVLTARRVLRLTGVDAPPLPEVAARQMDLPDGRPEVIAQLCRNGMFLAGEHPALKGYAGFFEAVAARVETNT